MGILYNIKINAKILNKRKMFSALNVNNSSNKNKGSCIIIKKSSTMILCRYSFRIRIPSYCLRFTHTIDYSKVPPLLDKDLEEMHVRGSGPGGQKVNKTANCVVLKHIPTGVVVKCQETRELHNNRKIARMLLQNKLDNFINRENSVEAQIKAKNEKKSSVRESKREKIRLLKETWKNRESDGSEL